MGSALELLTAGTTHKVKQAEINAKRTVQGAYNEKEAASASLSRYAQSVGNQRKMEAAGQALNAQAQNIQAALDDSVTGTFASRIQTASQLGAAAVAASAAGVGGGSVDAYRQVVSLNQAIQEQAQSAALESGVINAQQAMGNTIKNAVASLDNDQFAGNFNYDVYIDHVKQKSTLAAFVTAGTATYFGGPQAGMAALDLSAAGNRYANGDLQGGNQLINSALSKGFDAFKNYSPAQKSSAGDSFGQKLLDARSGFWSTALPSYTVK